MPIEVTRKELDILIRKVGDTRYLTLRDKLDAAEKAMRLATRQKNREVKQARRERANSNG